MPGIVTSYCFAHNRTIRNKFYHFLDMADVTVGNAFAYDCLQACYTPEGEEKVVDMTAKKSLSKLAIELEESENLIRQVYSECPDFDLIVPTLLTKPLSELHSVCHLLPGKSCCFSDIFIRYSCSSHVSQANKGY